MDKTTVGKLAGKMYVDGKELEGEWVVFTYLDPNQVPYNNPNGYVIGRALRVK